MELSFDLHPAQLEIFKSQARYKVAAAGRRFGKPGVLSTIVDTPSGRKTLGDINKGSFVFSPNGNPVLVQETTEPFKDLCYKVVFDNGEEVIAGQHHDWIVEKTDRCHSNREERKDLWTTEMLYEYTQSQLGLSKPSFLSIRLAEAVVYEQQDHLPIHPYVLGMWLGDGSSNQAMISTADIEICTRLDSLGYTTIKYKSPYHYGVKNLQKQLRDLDLLNNKHIPEIYFTASKEDRLELLKGLMDSDGSVSKGGRCSFSNGNLLLVEGVRRLLVSLGQKVPTTEHKSERLRVRESKAKLTYGMLYEHFSTEYTLSFTPTINIFNLERKSKRLKLSHQWPRHFIKDVIPVGEQLVKCIQVEGGEFLWSSSNIKTHNSYLSAVVLIIEGLRERNELGYDLTGKDVWYIAPTFQQGKDIMWGLLKLLGEEVIESTVENTATIRLINGRQIKIKGSDRPDTLRGVGLSFVVLDEYADMKPNVWEEIVFPTLTDVEGGALFIGTPKGRNHFHELFLQGQSEEDKWNEWESWHFNTTDNPILNAAMIDVARDTMTSQLFRQEFEANFNASGGNIFTEDMIEYSEEPDDGSYFIAVDLAGFGDTAALTQGQIKRLDEHAIAIVKVGTYGWWVKEIRHGRWGIREASLQILKAAKDVHAVRVGIEKGMAMNAVLPYLQDQMKRLNIFPAVEPVTHGNKKKTDRIVWALQGRLQQGRIKFNKGEWNRAFVEQFLDFPNPLSHDDLIDALSYIDQVALVDYGNYGVDVDDYTPMDADSGY